MAKSSGGQPGNNNATKNKPWQDALRKMAMRPTDEKDDEGKTKRKLEKIAETVVESAISGDLAAAKEIGDRLDGKSTDHKHVTGNVAHEHSGVSRSLEILGDYLGEGPTGDTEAPKPH